MYPELYITKFILVYAEKRGPRSTADLVAQLAAADSPPHEAAVELLGTQ